jgi:competence protein ComEC
MHVGIIFLLLSLMLSPLHLLPGGQQFKSAFILLLLVTYMFLAGASPAVVRATLMFGSVLIYKLLRKRYHFLNLLGFSAFIQMAMDPMIIFAVGFQLSYMAVLGIVLLFPLFEKSFNTPWKWVNYAYAWIGISLTATLFTTPWVLFYFGQFPTYFILSNVMVSLLVFVLVFLGFLTVLCIYIPWLNSLLAYMMEQALSLLEYIASWVAALPGARLTAFSWDEPGLRYLVIELALTALLLLLPKLILYKKSKPDQVFIPA